MTAGAGMIRRRTAVTTPLRVLVLGGGYAGTAVAKALDPRHDVTLVEQRPAFFHYLAVLRAVAEPSWSRHLQHPYDRLLRRGQVVYGRAVEVDDRRVSLDDGREITADILVIATGSRQPFPAKPDGADVDAMLGRLATASAALQEADSALVLGAGAVGLELAGEIASFHPQVHVTVVDPALEILPGPYRSVLRRRLHSELARLGITVLLKDAVDVSSLGPDGSLVPGRRVQTVGGSDVPADVWFRAFGAQPTSDRLTGKLAAAVTADGKIMVGLGMNVLGHDRVFAAGDVTDVAEPETAIAAARHATVIAANVDAIAQGRTPSAKYRPPATHAVVLPLGPDNGAAQLPLAGGLVLGRRTARLIKGRGLLVARTRAALNRR